MALPVHLYEQIARNRRYSWLLIFLMTSLLVVVGYFIGSVWWNPLFGAVVALFISMILASLSYFSGDKIVLELMGSQIADQIAYRTLHDVVEEMAIAAGLPKPNVYVIESKAANAFATGRDPQHASVAVTTGLLEILNREELQGVIGHEMSHVRNYDTLYAILMAVMVGAIVILCDSLWRSLRWGGLRSSSRSKQDGGATAIIVVIALVLSILAPIFASIIQFAMSRKREYLADSGSAELTRNPLALANALGKISGDPDPLDIANRGTQHLFIVNPLSTYSGTTEWVVGLFSTHPPIEDRIKILRELAHSQAR